MKPKQKMIVEPSWPDITEKEIRAVAHTMRTTFLGRGSKLPEFEDAIAKFVGRRYAVSTSSGAAALHLAIESLGIGKGDLVITTPFSFVASSHSILYAGAKPIFVDIERETANIDVGKVEAKVKELSRSKATRKKLKAILAVDVFGHPADWEELERIARRFDLRMIEDSCEALGSKLKYRGNWRNAGTFGDASVFSFAHNKQLTMGEGGVLLTDRKDIFDRARSLRLYGKEGGTIVHDYIRLGYNYHMSDMQAALGTAQLARSKEIFSKLARVARLYNGKLKEIPGIETQFIADNVKLSWFAYIIRFPERFDANRRDRVIERLGKRGIRLCRNYFPPIHLFKVYRDRFGYQKGDYPVTEAVSARSMSLPFFSNLTEREMDYVVENLAEAIQKI